MNLPTEEQCLNYFDEFKVPRNIKNHCLKVREVAVFLARELQKKGIPVNVSFVSSLAFFHDMFKFVALEEPELSSRFHEYIFSEEEIKMRNVLRKKYPNKYECEVAHDLLKDRYPELALSLLKVSNPKEENRTWEELLVYYADWRVFQEKVVPLEERCAYLRQRYPRQGDEWEKYMEKIKKKEEEIFKLINLNPAELSGKIKIPEKNAR